MIGILVRRQDFFGEKYFHCLICIILYVLYALYLLRDAIHTHFDTPIGKWTIVVGGSSIGPISVAKWVN